MTKIFKLKDLSYDLRKNNCIERQIIQSCKYSWVPNKRGGAGILGKIK